jgi:DNA-binding transcriptional ArsR family regulator
MWEKMFEEQEEVERVVFQALAHPMRRTILRIVAARSEGVSYTELITELGLSTGKLNYHLEQLEGLMVKNEDRRYILTSLGEKAVNQLHQIKQVSSPDDMKFLRIARASQRSSLQPALKSFLLVGVAFSFVILFVWAYVAYIAITEGAPLVVYMLLPILIAAGVGLVGSLVLALRKTPDWLRRVERRFLGPS